MAEHNGYWPFSNSNGPALAPEPAASTDTAPPRALAGQRLRLSVDNPLFGPNMGPLFLAPPDQDTDWRLRNLDSHTLDRARPAELVEMLADLSPDISRALWDFLRFANPGWEAKALRVGSEEVDERAQAALDAFLATLKGLYGSVDVILNRLFINAFLRGAFIAELVLDKSGRMPLDIAVPDARWIYFRRQNDPERGAVWEMYQYQGGQQVSLEKPTIRYVPVDPLPGSPYGRPLASPALFTTIFLMGLLHDLRRVVSQQGYPRLDIAINLERLLMAMPPDQSDDLEKRRNWLNKVVDEVTAMYSCLQPDDAYVHLDTTTVGRPVGAVSADSLGSIDGLIAMLERQSMRALKSNSLLMGLPEGMSEANSNRQWEVAAASTKALQHLCESVLEHLYTLALQAQGLQAKVEFRFAELRASELLRDAQVAALNAKNAALKYARGWISQDEAAKEGADKDKADQEEPRIESAGLQGGGTAGGGQNPDVVAADPGSNRSGEFQNVREILAEMELPARNGHG
jgi:hypothetical protein